MKMADINRSYLYEGLTNANKKSMMLWESAGRHIAEAQLTADQITQLFQQIEQNATAAGGNRTAIGQTKDAAGAVAKAYQDLKAKVTNSAIMQNFDQQYDQAAEKLKQATGGDQGVMQYVQKYRDFAKKHPIAQSLIYGALIAAAGISGAGAGGAAALGLLKMTDKLLQGEKFSKAAVAGAETGAVAYAAGQLGKAVRGGDNASALQPNDTTSTSKNYSQSTNGMQASWPTQGVVPPGILERFPPGSYEYMQNGDYWEVLDAAGNKMANFTVDSMNESYQLTNDQVTALFETIVIEAGLWSQFKDKVLGEPEERAAFAQDVKSGIGAAGKAVSNVASKAAGAVAQKAQTVGKNITIKFTADKLNKAWVKAGSPTDSEAIKDLLTAQGIDAGLVDNSMKAFNVTPIDRSRLPDINKMSKQQLQQLLQALEQPASAAKPHTGGKVAGQVSQTPGAIRQRQARAAKSAAIPAQTTTAPVQPTAAPTQTTSQQSMSQILKQRQAQGLGAYESVDFATLKTKLKEALAK
jgi:hypothetical protein